MLRAKHLRLDLHPGSVRTLLRQGLTEPLAEGSLRSASGGLRGVPRDERAAAAHLLHRPGHHPEARGDPGDGARRRARGRPRIRRARRQGRRHRLGAGDQRDAAAAGLQMVPHVPHRPAAARLALPGLRQLRAALRPPLPLREQLRGAAELPLLLWLHHLGPRPRAPGDPIGPHLLLRAQPRGHDEADVEGELHNVGLLLGVGLGQHADHHRGAHVFPSLGLSRLPHHDQEDHQGVSQEHPQRHGGADALRRARAAALRPPGPRGPGGPQDPGEQRIVETGLELT
mmetsp:Transcript_7827/g.21104  ORF Transcript_7827/g.21104 Transcript_7827/m.21104 type:complete len:285 (+) Transcript_7827:294-1148(+)